MSARKKSESRIGLKWFAVKTLFRTAPVGKPAAIDEAYDLSATLVEERVVLFRARGFSEAIRRAESDARTYARSWHMNPYGQRVVTRYLGACDAYELFDPPGAGKEVFSTTEIVGRGISDKAVVKQRLGHEETAREKKSRRSVLNREFAGSAMRGV
jgi:hypothetical protein